jgi:hypothetical protein
MPAVVKALPDLPPLSNLSNFTRSAHWASSKTCSTNGGLKPEFSGSTQFKTQKETPPFPAGFLDDI